MENVNMTQEIAKSIMEENVAEAEKILNQSKEMVQNMQNIVFCMKVEMKEMFGNEVH
tara:strand:- start:476 stop:646 length:171 start_codon:yes stop_codon:yes gene_type:complete